MFREDMAKFKPVFIRSQFTHVYVVVCCEVNSILSFTLIKTYKTTIRMVFIISRSIRRKVFLCLDPHSPARASMTSRLSGLSKLVERKMKQCSLLNDEPKKQ